MSESRVTPLLGFAGALGTITLAQVNQALAFVSGLLSIAYLVRQHVHFRRDKRK